MTDEIIADDVSTIDPAKLLEQANHAYDQGALIEAEELYGQLIRTGHCLSWGYFALGRIYRDHQEGTKAVDHFLASIASDPEFFWSHYELAVILLYQRRSPVELAKVLRNFPQCALPKLSPVHVENLEEAAMLVWESGFYSEAVSTLELLRNEATLSELAMVRIVERSTDQSTRSEIVTRLMALPPSRDFAFRILANYYQELGNTNLERECLERLRAVSPSDFQTHFALARSLARSGDIEALTALRANESRFSPRQIDFTDLVVRLEQSDALGALDSFRRLARLYDEVPLFPGIRLCYILFECGQKVLRDEVLDILDAFHPNNAEVALVRVNSFVQAMDFNSARAVFDARLAPIEPRPLSVRIAELELNAHSGQLGRAVEIADDLSQSTNLTLPAVRSILRVFCEAERHEDVVNFAVPYVTQENAPEVFEIIVRSARKCDRIRVLFDALPRSAADRNRAQQIAWEALVEDLAEAGDSDVIAFIHEFGLSELRLLRIGAKMGHRSKSIVVPEQIVFQCADAAYLKPALTSIVSTALSNVDIVRMTHFAIVAEDGETLSRAQAAARALNRRLGLSIEVFNAGEILSSGAKPSAKYGFFTAGQTLSPAAYYRIFFAHYLAHNSSFKHALYIDADTVVRRGLSSVFSLDSDKALLARPEVDRPEIRKAKSVLNLEGDYFNSGVLRFNLNHPEIKECLALSLRFALDPESVKLFQDQCALNFGFKNNFDPLPEEFNYFLTPKVTDAVRENRVSPIVIHYLDRPKPWDSLYRRDAREWFGWYGIVSEVID